MLFKKPYISCPLQGSKASTTKKLQNGLIYALNFLSWQQLYHKIMHIYQCKLADELLFQIFGHKLPKLAK